MATPAPQSGTRPGSPVADGRHTLNDAAPVPGPARVSFLLADDACIDDEKKSATEAMERRPLLSTPSSSRHSATSPLGGEQRQQQRGGPPPPPIDVPDPDEMGYGAVRLQLSRLSPTDETSPAVPPERNPSAVRRQIRVDRNWRALKARVLAGSVIIRSFNEVRGGANNRTEEEESSAPCRHGGRAGSCLICRGEKEEEEKWETAPLHAEGRGGHQTPVARRGCLNAFVEAVGGAARKIWELGHCVSSTRRSANGSRRSLLQFSKRRENMDALPYELSLLEIALAVVAYLLVGVLAFSFVFEDWSVENAVYFSMVTFTTIGYGDLVPSSRASCAFTMFFALTGIASLSVGLGVIGSRMVESELRAVKTAEQDSAQAFSILLGRSRKSIVADSAAQSRVDKVMSRDEVEEHIRDSWLTLPVLTNFLKRFWPALSTLLLGAFAIAWFEGWSVWATLYFCVVTSTTIGYGDYTPSRTGVKWAMVAYIPLAVGGMGHVMAAIADFIIERRREVHQKMLWCRDLTLSDLDAMDGDQNGAVSEMEYIEFMLVALKKVDSTLLDELHRQFQELDANHSGEITKHDLKVLAKKRMKRVRNKLELSSYKYQLLHPGKETNDSSRFSGSERSELGSDANVV